MNTHIDHIIGRVLTGNGSSEDFLLLSEWLHADEKNQKEFRLLKGYWDAEVSFRHGLQPGLSLEKVRLEIDKQEKQKRLSRRRSIVIPFAAAAILLIVLFSMQYFSSEKTEVREFYTYITDKNKSDFTLADGTKIVLNRHSRLTYSNDFGAGRREVALEGEAYFEVTKNPEKPFIVEMGNASIRVLGTTFCVKAEKGEDRISAILVEGSIRFESAAQQVLLSPDQELVFTRSTHQICIQPVDARQETAWKDGLLKYKSVPLCVLLDELEKRYEIPIHLENKKLTDTAVTVSGTFTEDQSLKEILRVIARSLPIEWSERDGAFYIR